MTSLEWVQRLPDNESMELPSRLRKELDLIDQFMADNMDAAMHEAEDKQSCA